MALKGFDERFRLHRADWQAPAPRRRRRRPGTALALLAVPVIAVVAGAVIALWPDPELTLARPNTLAIIDPGAGGVVATVPVGSRPTGVVAADGAAWVVNADDATVSRVDVEGRAVQRTIKVPSTNAALGIGAGPAGI